MWIDVNINNIHKLHCFGNMFYTCLKKSRNKMQSRWYFFFLLLKKSCPSDSCERVDEHVQASENGTERLGENKKGRHKQNKTANQ